MLLSAECYKTEAVKSSLMTKNPFNIYSCLLVVLGCLLGTGHAQSNAEFTEQARQMLAIYANPKAHITTKQRNLPELADFYEKYSSRLELTDEERSSIDTAVKKYREQEALQEDGVPPQGGFWMFILPVVIDLIMGAANKALAD
ncbi:protein Turandot E-like [Drosophila ficusphila]|uniref:protein Turandot E-like n=1 Tax=Drosophila ficusphila TaxID=30025 RepID=UPI001C8A12E6|nr:protein Turandot E-like [Drosophila ficusphila]